MTWEDIPGWFDFRDAYADAVCHFRGGTFVEVGCFLGRSLCSLAELVVRSTHPIRVVGVDTCLGSGVERPATGEPRDFHLETLSEGRGTLAGTLHANVVRCGFADLVDLMVMPPVRAAKMFPDESLSLVFLDAGHDYESVKADILAWLPKVKPGGWIGGDDYGRDDGPNVWPGVKRAVDEVLPGATPWAWDSWRYVVK
jgi:hypothetical protein